MSWKSRAANASHARGAGSGGDGDGDGDDGSGGGVAPAASYYKSEELSHSLVTLVSITKSFIGAASMELPFAFMNAGWLAATVGILVLCVIR